MPRQLPWAKKGGGNQAQVRPATARQAGKSRVSSIIDDEFFDGTVLASDKGKGRATELDDDLPNLPAEPSTPRTKTRTKDAFRKRREESSSPPPIGDIEQPSVERMHKGISMFDLRDDEWMMVEDEFLETAKLFTRHLHMAEYEKLKKTIEEKKKQAEIARPVVADAKLSATAVMKEKARIQEKKQTRAIRDVFASQNNVDEEDREAEMQNTNSNRATSSFMASQNPPTSGLKQPPNRYEAQDSDSEDLDALRPLTIPVSKPTVTPTPARAQIISTSVERSPATPILTKTNLAKPTFVKPAQPSSATKSRSRINRATPFDMLDDWVPKKTHSLPRSSPEEPAQPPVARRTSTSSTTSSSAGRTSRASVDTTVPKDLDTANVGKETTNRIAKRKADRKEEKEKTRKDAKLDEIPTFLF